MRSGPSARELLSMLIAALFAIFGIIPLFLAMLNAAEPSDFQNHTSPIYMLGRSMYLNGGTARY